MDRLVPYGPAGPGGGKKSAPESVQSVGLYVPLVMVVENGKPPLAESANVRLTPDIVLPAPASDISITFCPEGPTNRISMSAGVSCESPVKLAVTRLIEDPRPDTTMVDGYGAALVASRMFMVPALANELVAAPVLPMARKLVTRPSELAPSCSCSTAISVSPQTPFAVK